MNIIIIVLSKMEINVRVFLYIYIEFCMYIFPPKSFREKKKENWNTFLGALCVGFMSYESVKIFFFWFTSQIYIEFKIETNKYFIRKEKYS